MSRSVLLSLLLLTVSGCPRQTASVPARETSFAYDPGAPIEPVARIALLDARYSPALVARFGAQAPGAFDRALLSATTRALQSYFPSRAYDVGQTFEDWQALGPTDREEASFVVTVEYDHTTSWPELQREQHSEPFLGSTWQTVEATGSCAIEGETRFAVWEPLTGQRLDAFEGPIERMALDCSMERTRDAEAVNQMMHNAYGRMLESAFGDSTRALEARLTRERLDALHAQAQRQRDLLQPWEPSFEFAPEFDYEGIAEEGPAVSIALLSPDFSDELLALSAAPGDLDPAVQATRAQLDPAFQSALEGALMEYLTTSGFTLSGPFSSLDEMTFPEKQQSDLVLQITLDHRGLWPDISRTPTSSAGLSWEELNSTGQCGLGGAISFVLWEPLSAQRMLSRSAALSSFTQDCTVDGAREEQLLRQVLRRGYGSVLESAFDETMRQAARYFHPDEVRVVKEQAEEARARTRF